MKPKITIQGNTVASEGTPTRVNCHVSGFPRPKVSWKRYRALQETKLPSNVQYENGTSVIVIKKTELKDSGTYKCTAENRAGIAQASMILLV